MMPEVPRRLADRVLYFRSFSALKWLRAVMERHSSFLLTQTDLDSVLAPVYSSVQVSCSVLIWRAFDKMVRLKPQLLVHLSSYMRLPAEFVRPQLILTGRLIPLPNYEAAGIVCHRYMGRERM